MTYYSSPRVYIQSAKSVLDKICRIEQIIDATFDAIAAKAADPEQDEATENYSLDDGQTKISVKYRSIEQMMASIKALQTSLQYYKNQYNGRSMRLLNHEDTRLLR